VRDMEISIKATWMGRWKKENGKPDYSGVLTMGGHDLQADRIGVNTIKVENMVILSNILARWETFKCKYYGIGNNVLDSLLFGNSVHGRDNILVEVTVFGRDGAAGLGGRALDTRVRELLNEQCQVRERRDIGRILNRELNWAEYFRLREVLLRIKQEYAITTMTNDNQMDLETFVTRNKKGCKRYRNVLSGKHSLLYVNSDPRQIMAGRNARGGLVWDNRELCEINYKVWTISHLDAKFKDFCFRLVQGRLYLNQQLSRFAEVDRWCTFCGIKKEQSLKLRNILRNDLVYRQELEMLEGETALHLFWDCQFVCDIIKNVCNEIANTNQLTINREKYLCGYMGTNKDDSLFNVMFVNAIKYVLYKCKQRKKLPTTFYMRMELNGIFLRLWKFKRWKYNVEHLTVTARGLLD
jgi:hypothetical protein